MDRPFKKRKRVRGYVCNLPRGFVAVDTQTSAFMYDLVTKAPAVDKFHISGPIEQRNLTMLEDAVEPLFYRRLGIELEMQMIRDLTEISVSIVRQEMSERVRAHAERNLEERLLGLLLPEKPKRPTRKEVAAMMPSLFTAPPGAEDCDGQQVEADRLAQWERTREKLRRQLRSGDLDEREVELELEVMTLGFADDPAPRMAWMPLRAGRRSRAGRAVS